MTLLVYADILFLVDFLADYAVLFLTSKLTSSRTSVFRLLLASFVGALGAVVLVCMDVRPVWRFLYIFAGAAALCLIAFGKRGARPFIKLLFFFFLSAFLLYGGMYALYSLYGMLFAHARRAPPFLTTVVLLCFAYCLYRGAHALWGHGVPLRAADVLLSDGVRDYHLTLLCDSGNLLRDPLSGKPVTIVSSRCLSPELLDALKNTLDKAETSASYRHIKPRVIPVKTVCGTSLLYAFVPQQALLLRGKESHALDTIVAIDTHENAFGDKDGVLPAALLTCLE